jgi:hypothetical protein
MNKTYDVMKGQQLKNIAKRNYERQYTSQEQKKIIQIYNDYDDKTIALKQIKLMIKCKYLTQQKILHWMSKSKTGKAISSEFEDEVMVECNKLYNINFFDIKNNKNLNIKKTYSYSNIRECAKKIFDKDYWDDSSKAFIKQWHHDKRTYKLLFTNKWVCGMLKRYSERIESVVVKPSTHAITSTTSSTTDIMTSTSATTTNSMSSNSFKSTFQSTSSQFNQLIKVEMEPLQQHQQIESIAIYPPSMSISTISPSISFDETSALPSSSSSSSSSSSTEIPTIYPLRKVKIEPTLLEDIKILMLMRCLHPHDYESQHNYLSFS